MEFIVETIKGISKLAGVIVETAVFMVLIMSPLFIIGMIIFERLKS